MVNATIQGEGCGNNVASASMMLHLRGRTLRTAVTTLTLSMVLGQLPGPSGATTSPSRSLPSNLVPFSSPRFTGEGIWHAAGRLVRGHVAVYTTTLALPDSPGVLAGVAWMNTSLLHARLYSGSLSPGGLNWKLTAPISASASRTLVAAFNGGFLLNVSGGGYLSEGHLVAPLRVGAASLVIYKNGFATVGQWGRDVSMTSSVVAVRQNLRLLVDHGRAVAGLNPNDVSVWGASLYSKVNTWRSGLGITATGALVYAAGPMSVVDLASLLVRARAVRAMALDMNPLWPIFATYKPALPHGPARPTNGTDLISSMIQTPDRFFQPTYARDFITMSTS
ncbi:MAG: hypothetical protein HKL86_00175 [Acidimicrobiaceae bacterium]|nr:hypothetical protein [Acidimicrobiaceae bacterium]